MSIFLFYACVQSFPDSQVNTYVDNPNHDYDGDGVVTDDCDDQDPTIGGPKLYYIDQDQDGYASEASGQEGCLEQLRLGGENFIDIDIEEGRLPFDCDDTDSLLNHDDTDQDGISSCLGDCDDFNNALIQIRTVYQDLDEDGFGNAGVFQDACPSRIPEGYTLSLSLGDAPVFDCNDDNALINPLAEEVCDEVDNNCNGTVDEPGSDTVPIWFQDQDGDGFGEIGVTLSSCTQPAGYVDDKTDCNDLDPNINPEAVELCMDGDLNGDGFDDGIDNNCNGDIDEDSAFDAAIWFLDSDGDGFGAALVSIVQCDQPSQYVEMAGDCDDSSSSIYPSASENCNLKDDDCDGLIDEGSDSAAPIGAGSWYQDQDGDGFGSPYSVRIQCDQPQGFVSDDSDCDDNAAQIYPNADEYCNGVDDNCDGTTDEATAVDVLAWYPDLDGDSHGDSQGVVMSCLGLQPLNMVLSMDDCDDSDAAQFPGATEYCNQEDDNCDGVIDESSAVDATSWYPDGDGDTYGIATTPTLSCEQPPGMSSESTDCDDTNPLIRPGAAEVCNNIDDDCNALVDDDALDPSTYYLDSDSDGYGNAFSTLISCPDYAFGVAVNPEGYVLNDEDCDDSDAQISPAVIELCTLDIDENCDGDAVLGATDTTLSFADQDGDGFGSSQFTLQVCGVPSGYVLNDLDCNDTDHTVYPYTVDSSDPTWVDEELCNGKLDRCQNDWDGLNSPPLDEQDNDGDGYVECAPDIDLIFWPDFLVQGGEDCNDTDSGVHPNAEELCNGVSESCENVLPSNEQDQDGDGFVICDFDPSIWVGDSSIIGGDDCNDYRSDLYPGGAPLSSASDCLQDADGDGFTERSWAACPSARASSDFSYRFESTEALEFFSLGDLDQDGLSDLAILARQEDYFQVNNGVMRIFLGATLMNMGPVIDLQSSAPDQFIYGAAGFIDIGDIDGDGGSDLGFNGFSLVLGSALPLDGTSIGLHELPVELSIVPSNLSGAIFGNVLGDMDGDGNDELYLCVIPDEEGFIVWSSSYESYGVDVNVDDVERHFSEPNDVFNIGDIDNDGLSDISLNSSFPGMFYATSVLNANQPLTLSDADEDFPFNDTMVMCDFNGDGIKDYIYQSSAYYQSQYSGYSYYYIDLYDGAHIHAATINGLSPTTTANFWKLVTTGSGFNDVKCEGDLDGDGRDDIVVDSMYYLPSDGQDFSGSYTFHNTFKSIQLGDNSNDIDSAKVLQDINGDGMDELFLFNPSYGYVIYEGCEY